MSFFKENQILVLLGAGASVDAGIPHSTKMMNNVEELISNEWKKDFEKLFFFIKSSIHYSDGINGKFGFNSSVNIERFVNVLEELGKKKEHVLFPFVGSWNPTLIEVAGEDFVKAGELKAKIIEQLRDNWISLEDYKKADYFSSLEILQSEYNFPLRVFSLNYDLCLEKNCSKEKVERGFDDNLKWDWRRYDETNPESKSIYLYKLHGSTDWYYKDNFLKYSEDVGKIKHRDAAIIFGTTYKLQYKDPFLFYAYEFRKWTLETKLIVCIGYGFGDEHINQIIQQALEQNKERILLFITPLDDDNEKTRIEYKDKIKSILNCKNESQIKPCFKKAKEFMKKNLNLSFLASYFPEPEELFNIVVDKEIDQVMVEK
jgi:NAD-dependent SIR2 family protein deacetylase